jgi:hypothetical protein
MSALNCSVDDAIRLLDEVLIKSIHIPIHKKQAAQIEKQTGSSIVELIRECIAENFPVVGLEDRYKKRKVLSVTKRVKRAAS